MSEFNPDEWELHENYYFRNKETGRIIHEDTYFVKDNRKGIIDEADVLRYETIEEILEEAEEAAEYAEDIGNWQEHDGIMALVDELRSEMYD